MYISVVLLSDCKGTHFLRIYQIFRPFPIKKNCRSEPWSRYWRCRRVIVGVRRSNLTSDCGRRFSKKEFGGVVFQKNILNLHKILARTKPAASGCGGTSILMPRQESRIRTKFLIQSVYWRLFLMVRNFAHFYYRSQGQGSDKSPVVCIYHV